MLSTNEWDFWNRTPSCETVWQSHNDPQSIALNRYRPYDVRNASKIALSVFECSKQSHSFVLLQLFIMNRMVSYELRTAPYGHPTGLYERRIQPCSRALELNNAILIQLSAKQYDFYTVLFDCHAVLMRLSITRQNMLSSRDLSEQLYLYFSNI